MNLFCGLLLLIGLSGRAAEKPLSSQLPEPRPTREPFRPATGPFVEWEGPGAIRISWQTEQRVVSSLEITEGSASVRRFQDAALKTRHSLVVPDIHPEALYTYQIQSADAQGGSVSSKAYQFDATFNYSIAGVPNRPSPYPEDSWSELYRSAAQTILAETAVTKGYCLVLGVGEGRLAYELARQTELKIVAVEEDPRKVAAARKALDKAGLYGVRVSVLQGSLTNLPFGDYVANLIVSDDLLREGAPRGSAAEVFRCLRPAGGVAFLGQPNASLAKPLSRSDLEGWLAKGSVPNVRMETKDGLWAVIKREALAGAGDWTHQYGSADNSACSKDELVQGEMEVLWWGEPGPRPMPDRGARNPAAVSANGRLYVQGDRILFGMDSYNGSILWTVAAPELRRTNIPRDSSNMVAADDYLYMASGSYACGLQGQTGARDLTFKVPESSDEHPYDWGYLGVSGETLVGSGVKRGAAYVGDNGEWYDGAGEGDVSQVTSDYLFALDRHKGAPAWSYKNGVVLNSTITMGDGVIYFIESRSSEARTNSSGRINRAGFKDQALVALDLRTGQKLWERPVDFSKATRMLYLAYGNKTLTVVGASAKEYHLWAFDTQSQALQPAAEQRPVELGGIQLWEQHYPMARDHHGGGVQHPLIVGKVLYSEMRSFDLRTGAPLRTDLPERRGCGTMAASMNSFFYRHFYHGMWDLKTDQRTQFLGIRGGCWLGMIPSGGLVLAPETSSGCSCTHSIQTSLAYIPKKRAPAKEAK